MFRISVSFLKQNATHWLDGIANASTAATTANGAGSIPERGRVADVRSSGGAGGSVSDDLPRPSEANTKWNSASRDSSEECLRSVVSVV